MRAFCTLIAAMVITPIVLLILPFAHGHFWIVFFGLWYILYKLCK